MEKQILFRYCKLSRAAELLSLQVSDLINLAVMKDINCLIKLNSVIAKYYLWHESEELVNAMGSVYYWGGNTDDIFPKLKICSLSRFGFVKDVCTPLNSKQYPFYWLCEEDDSEKYGLGLDITASGLWVLPSYTVDEIESNAESLLPTRLFLHNDFFSPEQSFIEPWLPVEMKVSASDLYITCEDVIRIMNGEFNKSMTESGHISQSEYLEATEFIQKNSEHLSKELEIHQSKKKAIKNRAQIKKAIDKLLVLYPSNNDSDDDRYRNKNNIIIKGRVAKLIINHEAILFDEGASPIKDDKLLRSIVSDCLDEMGWKRR
ncbi:hypothetical protein [Providencia sp. Me31A]|uniref:hypothetical protein n=1 Tax=Providencia sp. Me31A TaxID=3392637 RepID=UPI003D2D28A1